VTPGAAYTATVAGSSAARGSSVFARDHEALDLRRALVELHDLRVARELLDRMVLDEAVAAVDLRGVGRDLHRGVGREALGVRGLERVAAALVESRAASAEPERRGVTARGPEWHAWARSGTKRTAMAAPRRFDLEDILNRPGTYFNPETEVLLVVDDAPELDADLFEEGEGGEWVLLGDDVPLDERARDEVIERFEVRHHPGATSAPAEDDVEEEEEELEPDEEEPEL
jgi:hypothetical protein